MGLAQNSMTLCTRNRSRWGSKAFRNCSETQWHCQRKESTALPLCIQRHVNATQWQEIECISIYGAQGLLLTRQSDIMPCCRIGMHSIPASCLLIY
jgi:hypothetical protein